MEQYEDLRIVKTRKAIRAALTEMICEMEYGQVNVKELCARAMINRKTFYLHYESLAFAYFGSCSAILYRQWVADGKTLPLEELIATATRLICGCMASVVKGE